MESREKKEVARKRKRKENGNCVGLEEAFAAKRIGTLGWSRAAQ